MIGAEPSGIIQEFEANSAGSQHDSVALKKSDLYKSFMVDGWQAFEGSYIAEDLRYPVYHRCLFTDFAI